MRLVAGPFRLMPAALLALLILQLSACSASRQAETDQQALQAALAQMDQRAVGLPAPAELPRAGSAEATVDQTGADVKLSSPGAVLNADQLVLDASSRSQGGEWGQFTITDPEATAYTSLVVDSEAASQFWVGLADTLSNRWIWSGPFEQSATLDLSTLAYIVPSERVSAVIMAPAGESASINALHLESVRPDNNAPNALLAPPSSSGSAPLEVQFDASGSDAGGDPGDSLMLYEWDFENDGTVDLSGPAETSAAHTYTDPGAYVALLRVTDSHGATAEDSSTISVTAAGNNPPAAVFDPDTASGIVPLTVDFDASASSAGGDPGDSITLYEWDFDNDGVYEENHPTPTTSHEYRAMGRALIGLRVTDSVGNQATASGSVDALPQEKTLDTQAWGELELFNVGGNPALAYAGKDDKSVRFIRATDPLGQNWGAPVTVATLPVQEPGTLSAIVVNGRPAIVYAELIDISGPEARMLYVRALDAEGSAWGTPLEPAVLTTSGNYSINIVQGRPAIAFNAPGTSDTVDLWYMRASNANGTSWGAPVDVDAEDFAGYDAKLRPVNGQPAICYKRTTTGPSTSAICYCRALDSTGANWGTPVELATSPDTTLAYPSMALQEGRPVVSYVKRNIGPTESTLNFLRALDDDGSVWPAAQIVDTGADGNDFNFSNIVSDGPRSYIVTKFANSGAEMRFYAALDSDGTSWDSPLVLASGDGVGTFSRIRQFGGYFHIVYGVTNLVELRYVNNVPVP